MPHPETVLAPIGAACVVYGLYLAWAPLGWMASGVALLMAAADLHKRRP